MVHQQITTFHLDFSTLDIEEGKKTISPLSISYVIHPTIQQPILQIKGFTLEEKQQNQPEEKAPARKRRR